MFGRAMLFQQPSEDVLGYLLALLCHVGVDTDIKVRALGVGAVNFVQKVGEPEEVVFIADHPVEVNATMICVWR